MLQYFMQVTSFNLLNNKHVFDIKMLEKKNNKPYLSKL